jgi:hypothetical protein
MPFLNLLGYLVKRIIIISINHFRKKQSKGEPVAIVPFYSVSTCNNYNAYLDPLIECPDGSDREIA